jgi:hypothetical protein
VLEVVEEFIMEMLLVKKHLMRQPLILFKKLPNNVPDVIYQLPRLADVTI